MKTEKRNIGAFTDPKTNDYIRWAHDGFKLYLSAVDCYRYAGVKRVEVPQGSSLKKAIRGARTVSFWKENYDYSGTEVKLGVPFDIVQDLKKPLPEGLALKVSGGFERLEDFLADCRPRHDDCSFTAVASDQTTGGTFPDDTLPKDTNATPLSRFKVSPEVRERQERRQKQAEFAVFGFLVASALAHSYSHFVSQAFGALFMVSFIVWLKLPKP